MKNTVNKALLALVLVATCQANAMGSDATLADWFRGFFAAVAQEVAEEATTEVAEAVVTEETGSSISALARGFGASAIGVAKATPGFAWNVTKTAPGFVADVTKATPGFAWNVTKATPGFVADVTKAAPGFIADVATRSDRVNNAVSSALTLASDHKTALAIAGTGLTGSAILYNRLRQPAIEAPQTEEQTAESTTTVETPASAPAPKKETKKERRARIAAGKKAAKEAVTEDSQKEEKEEAITPKSGYFSYFFGGSKTDSQEEVTPEVTEEAPKTIAQLSRELRAARNTKNKAEIKRLTAELRARK